MSGHLLPPVAPLFQAETKARVGRTDARGGGLASVAFSHNARLIGSHAATASASHAPFSNVKRLLIATTGRDPAASLLRDLPWLPFPVSALADGGARRQPLRPSVAIAVTSSPATRAPTLPPAPARRQGRASPTPRSAAAPSIPSARSASSVPSTASTPSPSFSPRPQGCCSTAGQRRTEGDVDPWRCQWRARPRRPHRPPHRALPDPPPFHATRLPQAAAARRGRPRQRCKHLGPKVSFGD